MKEKLFANRGPINTTEERISSPASSGYISDCYTCFSSIFSSPSTSSSSSSFSQIYYSYNYNSTCGRSQYGSRALKCQVLLFISMIVYSFVLFFTFPQPLSEQLRLGLSETRIVHANTIWYSKLSSGNVTFQDVEDVQDGNRGSDITLLKFANNPPLTSSDSWTSNNTTINVAPQDYYYLSWYFFHGSSLYITMDCYAPFDIYIVKGKKGYNKWHSGKDFSEYLVSTVASNSSTSFNVFPNDDDFYFIIFDNTRYHSSWSTVVKYSITSLILDTSNHIGACNLPCSMKLKYDSSEVFVLLSPRVSTYLKKGGPDSVFIIEANLLSRDWVVALAFSLPIGFMFVFFLVLMKWSCERASQAGNNDPSSPLVKS